MEKWSYFALTYLKIEFQRSPNGMTKLIQPELEEEGLLKLD